jgi:hypothetical protein
MAAHCCRTNNIMHKPLWHVPSSARCPYLALHAPSAWHGRFGTHTANHIPRVCLAEPAVHIPPNKYCRSAPDCNVTLDHSRDCTWCHARSTRSCAHVREHRAVWQATATIPRPTISPVAACYVLGLDCSPVVGRLMHRHKWTGRTPRRRSHLRPRRVCPSGRSHRRASGTSPFQRAAAHPCRWRACGTRSSAHPSCPCP